MVGSVYSSLFGGGHHTSQSSKSGSAAAAGGGAAGGAFNAGKSQFQSNNAVKDYANKVRNSGTIPPRVSKPDLIKSATKGGVAGAVMQASSNVVEDAYHAYKQGGWGAAGKSLLSHMVFY